MSFKIPDRLINLMILLVTTCLCVVILEISLRLVYGYGYLDRPFMYRKFHQYDPEIGPILSPNREGMFRTAEGDRFYSVKINADGFRGGDLVDRQTPKIAVLGDSFIFGYGVDQEDVFSTILDKMTAADVINLGIGGTSLDQMYLLFTRYLATLTFSDVVLYISPNDFEDLLHPVRYGISSPYLVRTGATYAFRFPEKAWSDQCQYSEALDQVVCVSQSLKSRLKFLLKQFLLTDVVQHHRLPPNIRGEEAHNKTFLQTFSYERFAQQFHLPPGSTQLPRPSLTSEALPEKIQRMDWVLRQFIELSNRYHFRVHVIYDRIDQDEEAYLQQVYCPGRNCISFGQYRQEFRRLYPDESLMCPRNPHWNEIGHRLFAYVLYDNL